MGKGVIGGGLWLLRRGRARRAGGGRARVERLMSQVRALQVLVEIWEWVE